MPIDERNPRAVGARQPDLLRNATARVQHEFFGEHEPPDRGRFQLRLAERSFEIRQRHGGSIGTNMTPGRTFLNLKMPGQYGNERETILNLVIAKVLDDEGLLLIKGGIPGSKNGVVTVRGAVKTKKKKAS